MRWTFLPVWVCFGLLVGCTTSRNPAGDSSAREPAAISECNGTTGSALWARTALYFGLQKPDGSFTSNDEYQHFLDEQVTPRFRDGFTVLEGRGQYLGANDRLWREPTKILVILYAPDPARSAAIDELRRIYKAAFQQESVMRVDDTACVAF